jgi:hypothetical protein
MPVPGPGQYDSSSALVASAKLLRARIKGDAQLVNADNPFTGANLLLSGKKFLGVHTPQHQAKLKEIDAAPPGGFGSSESRDCLNAKKSPSPDPGSYDKHESLDQSITSGLKEQARLGKHGVFGATRTAERFHSGVKGQADGPGPDEYQRGAGSPSPRRTDMTGVTFRSSSPQRTPFEDERKENPGPGDYEAIRTPGPLGGSPPKRFRQGRTDHLSFGSAQTRFGSMEGLFGAQAMQCPGPGEYDPEKPPKRVTGMAKSTSGRNLQRAAATGGKKEAHPGPGAYDTAGSIFRKISFRTNDGNCGGQSSDSRGQWLGLEAQSSSTKTPDPSVSEPIAGGGGAGGGMGAMRFRLKQSPEA